MANSRRNMKMVSRGKCDGWDDFIQMRKKVITGHACHACHACQKKIPEEWVGIFRREFESTSCDFCCERCINFTADLFERDVSMNDAMMGSDCHAWMDDFDQNGILVRIFLKLFSIVIASPITRKRETVTDFNSRFYKSRDRRPYP